MYWKPETGSLISTMDGASGCTCGECMNGRLVRVLPAESRYMRMLDDGCEM